MVDSLWNTIKHTYLIDFNRPRLDLAIHLILRHALPTIRLKVLQLSGNWRHGRGETMSDWQKAFRADWLKHTLDRGVEGQQQQQVRDNHEKEDEPEDEAPSSGNNSQIAWHDATEPDGWVTDLDRWVCSCPSYLLSRFLCCKHLVRMVNARLSFNPRYSLRFCTKLRRYHTPPFYRIETIHPQLPDYTRSRRNGGDGGDGDNDDDDDFGGPGDGPPPVIDPSLIEPTLANPNPGRSKFTATRSNANDAEPNRVS